MRLGGNAVDGIVYGTGNKVYGNTIYANGYSGVKIMQVPQIVCANNVSDNPGGVSRGQYGSEYDPAAPCAIDINADDRALTPAPGPDLAPDG